MALPPGSIPPPTARPTLPNPRSISAKPKPKAGKNTPARRRILAASAGGPNPGGVGVAPANPYQSQAQAEIDPIIAAITAAATGQAGTADKAIQGLTDSYAKGISGIDYGAPYSSGEAQQAAVDAALQQSATGQGSDLAAALSQRLQALQGSSGGAAVQQAAAALSSQGAGAGQAQLASGSAALNQLISDAAAAKGYGQKMPGVIDSAGLQGIAGVQNQAQQAISQGTLQAESQLPQIEQSLQADHLQAQSNKQTQAYRNQEIAARQAALGISSARAQASIAQGNARLQQGAQRIGLDKLRLAISQNQGQQRINIEAQRAAQSALSSNRSYGLRLKSLGLESARLQMQATKSELLLQNKGLTPAEISRYKAMSYGLAHEGFSSTDSGTGKPYTFQTVLNQMTEKGIPPSLAMKALNAAGFKPGVRGAPPKYGPGMFAGLANAVVPPFSVSGTSKISDIGNAVERGAAKTIVGLAHDYLGTPYVWGGESPKGFDCSGFAQFLYGKAGIKIPRTTYTQWQAPNGKSVGKNALLPGDLVFFKGGDSIGGLPGHVGIYIGGGKMIDEPHTGASARIESVATFGGYMGAKRFGKG